MRAGGSGVTLITLFTGGSGIAFIALFAFFALRAGGAGVTLIALFTGSSGIAGGFYAQRYPCRSVIIGNIPQIIFTDFQLRCHAANSGGVEPTGGEGGVGRDRGVEIMQCAAIIPTDKKIAIFDRCGRAYRPLSLQHLLLFHSSFTVRPEGYGHLCAVCNTAVSVDGYCSAECAAGDLTRVDDLARFCESASFDDSVEPIILRITAVFVRISHLAMEYAVFDGAIYTIHHSTVEGAAFDHTRVVKETFVVHLTIEGTAFDGRTVGHRAIENAAIDFCRVDISTQIDTAVKCSTGYHHTSVTVSAV